MQSSKSEAAGIAAMPDDAVNVLSVGISTGGVAEMLMAAKNPARRIVATTIDEQGVAFARQFIAGKGYGTQVDAKLEDVSRPLPYPDNHFDYIYARLVLHYLSKQALPGALAELYRVLKPAGKLFVVVRSTACPDASGPSARFDEHTGYTTYEVTTRTGTASCTRYFHTLNSITMYLQDAGFVLESTNQYDEHLYKDFMRTVLADSVDNIIEVVGKK